MSVMSDKVKKVARWPVNRPELRRQLRVVLPYAVLRRMTAFISRAFSVDITVSPCGDASIVKAHCEAPQWDRLVKYLRRKAADVAKCKQAVT